ncbi:DUF1800 domain-containing protein [Robbsia sp. Bb-Pol-6]|uniref:DUF1800 domain-containing protein n=1 Tax=Robbsia betulipollinis TaxID=2981849 RepID=A0ABT3ZS47_9BURK|nr:DUF1800 domain-containing protein [Robbsia betulipollinis]MCY0389376.1 DUF1800 domain-containing protein [Robbsia betulipollinis]
MNGDDTRFLLTRTGFAPDRQEVANDIGLTRAQAVDRLLAAGRTTAFTPPPDWAFASLPLPQDRQRDTPEQRRAEQRLRGQRYAQARAWWAGEMALTPSPLTERMTLFWHNHFVSGQDKVPWPQLMLAQNALLRREALGNFGAMLHDVARDPAMLRYLDGASNRKGHPNENFAREVMELFTLGEGHYTQQDVAESARAYTGWSLDAQQRYVWKPALHDAGIKTVLGRTGAFDGDQMLDVLLDRPETARFVTAKLWREFISDTPDPVQVARIADGFRASHYDIRTVLRAIFLSDDFWAQEGQATLARSPVSFVIGTIRAFDVRYDTPQLLADTIRGLGEDLFEPPNVKGWPGGQAWINSSTLLARERFVALLFRSSGTGRPTLPRAAMAGTGGLHFDPAVWLAAYGASPTAVPDAVVRRRMIRAVLPTHPIEPVEDDGTGSAFLQGLLADPVYQLE